MIKYPDYILYGKPVTIVRREYVRKENNHE